MRSECASLLLGSHPPRAFRMQAPICMEILQESMSRRINVSLWGLFVNASKAKEPKSVPCKHIDTYMDSLKPEC